MNNDLIIGVDGGGTKTESLIANREGKILSRGMSGPANPRNQGIEITAENIAESIKKALSQKSNKGKKKDRILAVFIALAAMEEEYKDRSGMISKLLRKGVLSGVSQEKIFFGSDQEAAFRSGTDESEGIVVIAGTGAVVCGWRGKKKVKVNGWGYLADEGSAFWIGQRAYQAIAKELDGRGEKTLITKLARFNQMNDINKKIYREPLKTLPSLAIFVSEAGELGDKMALAILKEGAEELACGVGVVANKLGFKKNFPLVISGGMFKSKAFGDFFRIKTKKYTSRAIFIIPTLAPAFGSLKLAMEKINRKK